MKNYDVIVDQRHQSSVTFSMSMWREEEAPVIINKALSEWSGITGMVFALKRVIDIDTSRESEEYDIAFVHPPVLVNRPHYTFYIKERDE
jgi:hypothetical protein